MATSRTAAAATAAVAVTALGAAAVKAVWPRPVGLARLISRKTVAPGHRHPQFAEVADSVEVQRDHRVAVAGEPDVSYDLYLPRDVDGRPPLVVWVHGGGFVTGDKATVAQFSTLVAARGYAVAAPNYSLAPEHTHPTAVIQVRAVIEHLLAEPGPWDPRRLVLGGESAGASLAAEIANIETNPDMARLLSLRPILRTSRLAGLALYSGPYNRGAVDDSGFPFIRSLLSAYLGKPLDTVEERDEAIDAIQWATGDWPPTYLSAGDADPFDASGRELGAVLRHLGVDVTESSHRGPRLRHAFQYDYSLPQARDTLNETLAFLNRVLPPAPRRL